MSLAGQVGDVGLADVLQMISLSGRTGTLTISANDSDFDIGFHEGSFEFRLDVLPASTASRETTPLVRLDTQRILFEAVRIAGESNIHDETALSYKRLFQDTSEMFALSSFPGTAPEPQIDRAVPDATATEVPHEPPRRAAEEGPRLMDEALSLELPELQVVSSDESFLAELQTCLTFFAKVVSRPLSAVGSSSRRSFVLLDLRRGRLGEDDVRTLARRIATPRRIARLADLRSQPRHGSRLYGQRTERPADRRCRSARARYRAVRNGAGERVPPPS